MSLEMELRDAVCAKRGCGETMKEIRSPPSNKYPARAQRVRGGNLLRPVYPVSQQIGRISLSLPRAENPTLITTFAPKDNSSAIRLGPDGFCEPGPHSIP